jgi:nicotinate-nucleotide pyrophosphorylase (carboxylating)
MTDFAHLLPPSWKPQITAWLAEDTPSFDYGGYVVGEAQRTAYLLGKGNSEAVLAGMPFFTEVFNQLGCECVSKPLSAFISHMVVFTPWTGWNGT